MISERLRVARARKSLHIWQVAQAADATVRTMDRVESGSLPSWMPTSANLIALAEVLDVSVEWLTDTAPLEFRSTERAPDGRHAKYWVREAVLELREEGLLPSAGSMQQESETIIERFPGLRKAALEIAYDNGLINRFVGEKDYLKSLDEVLGAEGVYEADLQAWDEWLESLDEDDLLTVATGDEYDMGEILAKAPTSGSNEGSLHGLLNDIFHCPPPREAQRVEKLPFHKPPAIPAEEDMVFWLWAKAWLVRPASMERMENELEEAERDREALDGLRRVLGAAGAEVETARREGKVWSTQLRVWMVNDEFMACAAEDAQQARKLSNELVTLKHGTKEREELLQYDAVKRWAELTRSENEAHFVPELDVFAVTADEYERLEEGWRKFQAIKVLAAQARLEGKGYFSSELLAWVTSMGGYAELQEAKARLAELYKRANELRSHDLKYVNVPELGAYLTKSEPRDS